MQAAVVAQTAAKSLADMQAAEDAEESSKDKERDSEKESQDGTESRDKHEKQRKAALDKLEKASQDSLFGQASCKFTELRFLFYVSATLLC